MRNELIDKKNASRPLYIVHKRVLSYMTRILSDYRILHVLINNYPNAVHKHVLIWYSFAKMPRHMADQGKQARDNH